MQIRWGKGTDGTFTLGPRIRRVQRPICLHHRDASRVRGLFFFCPRPTRYPLFTAHFPQNRLTKLQESRQPLPSTPLPRLTFERYALSTVPLQ